jgi:hypothetical protein
MSDSGTAGGSDNSTPKTGIGTLNPRDKPADGGPGSEVAPSAVALESDSGTASGGDTGQNKDGVATQVELEEPACGKPGLGVGVEKDAEQEVRE